MHGQASCFVLLLGTLLAAPASAGDLGSGVSPTLGATRVGTGLGPSSYERARAVSADLERTSEARRFEARVQMLNQSRDAERRQAERELRRQPSALALQRYQGRLRREDDMDDLRLRSELSQLVANGDPGAAAAWWQTLGPATQRNLLRGGLELRRIDRERERDVRLDALERDTGQDTPDAADSLFGAPE